MKATDRIPRNKINLWYDMFKTANTARIVSLYDSGFTGEVDVCYSFDDMEACDNFRAEWYRLNTPITEKQRPKWKRILSRMTSFLR